MKSITISIILLLILSSKVFSQITYNRYYSTFINEYPFSGKVAYHSPSNGLISLKFNCPVADIGRTVDVRIFEARKSPDPLNPGSLIYKLVHTYPNCTIQATPIGAAAYVQAGENAPAWGQGIFFAEVFDNTTHSATTFRDILIVRENTTVFAHGGMNFVIHYTNDAFDHHVMGNAHMPTYLANLETIINDVWDREVVDWRLCDGLMAVPPKAGGSCWQCCKYSE
jgi:hypothetical protein